MPVRVELGPRDLAEGVATIARRDQEERSQAPLAELASLVPDLLDRMQAEMLDEATRFRNSATIEVGTVAEASEAGQQGVARIAWEKLGADGEEQLLRRRRQRPLHPAPRRHRPRRGGRARPGRPRRPSLLS